MLVMGYSMLTFLPNVMAMGLFVSIVMALSRLYSDSEMVIWFASGVGVMDLLRPLMRFAWPVLMAIATLAIFVLPWANRQIDTLKDRYEQRGDLERVQPGQFQEAGGGTKVFFVEKSELQEMRAHNVFVATREGGKETITAARSGYTEWVNGDKMLVLENGQRLEMSPDGKEARVGDFDRYHILVAQDPAAAHPETPLGSVPFIDLVRDPTPHHLGEVSIRLGFAIAAINLTLLALAATRINPRVGRSGNLLFSMLLFQVYFNLLSLGQNWIAAGKFSFLGYNIVLHGGMFLLAMGWLAQRHYNWRLWPARRAATAAGAAA
jgi:lipopolysaccharide export system permease protein